MINKEGGPCWVQMTNVLLPLLLVLNVLKVKIGKKSPVRCDSKIPYHKIWRMKRPCTFPAFRRNRHTYAFIFSINVSQITCNKGHVCVPRHMCTCVLLHVYACMCVCVGFVPVWVTIWLMMIISNLISRRWLTAEISAHANYILFSRTSLLTMSWNVKLHNVSGRLCEASYVAGSCAWWFKVKTSMT